MNSQSLYLMHTHKEYSIPPIDIYMYLGLPNPLLQVKSIAHQALKLPLEQGPCLAWFVAFYATAVSFTHCIVLYIA